MATLGFEAFSSIEFQISLFLFVALIGYFISTRIGQSVVIGEILVGIVVGPSVLNWITYTDFIQNLATMGAIFLLFVVGLQTKFKEIYNMRAAAIALVGVVVPWIGGYAVAQWFGFPVGQSIFVGTAMTATSIAITAQVLKEMGKLDSPAAKAIIGAAVVDDVLALLALAMTREFLTSTIDVNSIVISIAIAFGFLFFGVIIGTKFINPYLEGFDKWAKKHAVEKATFLAAVAFAFAYALVAEAVGLSAIVGAFIAGVSLESLKIHSYREGSEYLEAIFAAIFFVSLGVLLDASALGSVAVFILVLTAVAIVTKAIGCGIPARLMGLNTTESMIVGLGMVPRGEIAIIAALIGLTSGFISQEIYSAVIIVSLLTTVVTPIFIKRLFESKAYRAKA